MLDTLMGKLFTPSVDFVDYADGLLAFKARKKLKPETQKVILRMSFGTVTAHVELKAFDEASKIYRARLLNYEVVQDALDDDRRGEVRLPGVMRVTSADLPGYSGTTEDLSVGGTRIATSGALEQGRTITIKIELDDPELPDVVVNCEVRWSGRQVNDDGYQSGLRFLNLDRKYHRIIERYVDERLAAERRLHTLGED